MALPSVPSVTVGNEVVSVRILEVGQSKTINIELWKDGHYVGVEELSKEVRKELKESMEMLIEML